MVSRNSAADELVVTASERRDARLDNIWSVGGPSVRPSVSESCGAPQIITPMSGRIAVAIRRCAQTSDLGSRATGACARARR